MSLEVEDRIAKALGISKSFRIKNNYRPVGSCTNCKHSTLGRDTVCTVEDGNHHTISYNMVCDLFEED